MLQLLAPDGIEYLEMNRTDDTLDPPINRAGLTTVLSVLQHRAPSVQGAPQNTKTQLLYIVFMIDQFAISSQLDVTGYCYKASRCLF